MPKLYTEYTFRKNASPRTKSTVTGTVSVHCYMYERCPNLRLRTGIGQIDMGERATAEYLSSRNAKHSYKVDRVYGKYLLSSNVIRLQGILKRREKICTQIPC